MSSQHIFITGATGYIGGTVLHHLLTAADADTFKITALVRDPSARDVLAALNVTTVLGGLDDAETITRAVADADIVVNTADCDHLSATGAIIAGLKTPSSRQRKRILIHTSGTGIIGDDARGEYRSETVWSDLDTDRIFSIPESAPHRLVDDALITAAKSAPTSFDAFIICPPTVYGLGSGPINKLSRQIPGMADAFITRGKGGTIGAGENVWSNVHVEDLADMYMNVMRGALAGSISTLATPGGGGYYFCQTGEHVLVDVYRAVAQVLHKLSAIPTAEVDRLSDADVDKYLHNAYKYLGSNSRSSSRRANKENIGWKPKYADHLFEQLQEEMTAVIARRNSGHYSKRPL